MSVTRSDLHRPSLLDPAEYAFLGCFYGGSSGAMAKAYREDEKALTLYVETGGYSAFVGNYAEKGTCDHCGAAFAHGVVFLHKPTGETVSVGHICASNTLGLPSRAVKVRRTAEAAAAAATKRERMLAATAGWRAENGDVVSYLESLPSGSHYFLTEAAWKLAKYGSLFPGHAAAVRKWMAAGERRAAEVAVASTVEIPALTTGRVTLTGEIVSTKWTDGNYGSVLKMLVKLDDGNKVWGTMPTSLCSVESVDAGGMVSYSNADRGDRVEFTAEVEASRDDAHFGFFKRPMRARLLVAA